MSLIDSTSKIIHLFEREIVLSTSLLKIMKNEQLALSENNLAEFEAALNDKLKTVVEIESTENNLVETLNKIGLSMEKQDLKKLVLNCNPNVKNKLSQLLKQLGDIAQQCHEQNLINNRIIAASNNNVQQILEVLRGQTPGQEHLYDLSGKSADKTQSQILGRA